MTRYIVVLLVAAAVIAVWIAVSRETSEQGALVDVPADERGALYQRTLENLRFCKAHNSQGFETFCHREAEFIVAFPECDEPCRALAQSFIVWPQR